MSDQDQQSLTDLAAALSTLAPQKSGIDRDRLMYLAGCASVTAETPVASGSATKWLWPMATGVMTAVALLLGVLLVFKPPPQTTPLATPEHELPLDGKRPPSEAASDGLAAELPAAPNITANDDYLQPDFRISWIGVDAVQPHPPTPTTDAAEESWKAHSPHLLHELLGV